MPEFGEPSELELQVLGVLWERGECTVHEVMTAIPDGKKRAYTTVLSVMQVMEKKGLVTHKLRGRSYAYSAAVKRARVLGPIMRRLVRNVFGGSPAAAMQHLLGSSDVSEAELDAVEELLRNSREGKHKGS